jgi:branched-chain amino acid transport system permease protein
MFSEDTILLFYEITDVIIAGLSTGSVYALMAVGMTLVYGVTKAFNFAYGDFFNMGGYFAWILIFGLGLEFGGYLTVLVIVMPLMFAVGYGLEKLMVAPLRKRKDWENKVMMLTLGLALFLTSLYTVVFGVNAYQDIMIFVMSIGGILLFGWMLNNTRIGMAVQAVAQNPEGAKIVGIPQGRIFASTFAISTVMVGFGGILLSQKWFINPMSGGTIMCFKRIPYSPFPIRPWGRKARVANKRIKSAIIA